MNILAICRLMMTCLACLRSPMCVWISGATTSPCRGGITDVDLDEGSNPLFAIINSETLCPPQFKLISVNTTQSSFSSPPNSTGSMQTTLPDPTDSRASANTNNSSMFPQLSLQPNETVNAICNGHPATEFPTSTNSTENPGIQLGSVMWPNITFFHVVLNLCSGVLGFVLCKYYRYLFLIFQKKRPLKPKDNSIMLSRLIDIDID